MPYIGHFQQSFTAKGLSKMAISLNLLARPTSAPDEKFRMVLSVDLRLGRTLKTREMQRN